MNEVRLVELTDVDDIVLIAKNGALVVVVVKIVWRGEERDN